MRRLVLEWSLLAAAGLSLTAAAVWVESRWVDPSSYHLRFPTSRNVQEDLHVIVRDGDLILCDQFEGDPSGGVVPLVVYARNVLPGDFARGARLGGFAVPGLEVRYFRMADDGYLIWSLRASLLIPSALLGLLAVVLWVRVRRMRWKESDGVNTGR